MEIAYGLDEKKYLKAILENSPDLLEAFRDEDWEELDTLISDPRYDGSDFYKSIYVLDPELLDEILNELKYIPKFMFYGYDNLTDFTISNNITKIERGSFYNCTGLKNIKVPESVTYIDRSAFRGCINLNLKLPLKFKLAIDIYQDCKSVKFY